MSDTTHTPTPWVDNGAGLIYGQSESEDGAPFVADVCDNPGTGEYTELEQANTALICKAVNNHGALVGALRAMVREFDRYDTNHWQAAALDAARELLTKLEA